MPLPYDNREYVDHVETIAGDMIDEGLDKVSAPQKMLIRDMAVLVEAQFNGESVEMQYSPDEMETKQADLIPANMSWYTRSDGIFTDPAATLMKFWENVEGAEGWFRFRVPNHAALAALKIKTRPRVEKII